MCVLLLVNGDRNIVAFLPHGELNGQTEHVNISESDSGRNIYEF